MAVRNNWTREETILAMDLYTRTPYGKISESNQNVRELASLIGRSPGAVVKKMFNLAHHDPELKARNLSALAHGSKLDPIIYNEFANNIEELAFQAQNILAKLKHTSIEEMLPDLEIKEIPAGEYKERETKTRIGQKFFRESVLASYSNSCCITGIKNVELLIASHIKPWKVSDVKNERTNPSNGLCLNALHDKAFDRGFITIDMNYRIIYSKHVKEIEMDTKTREWFDSYCNKQIVLPSTYLPGKEFIEYHNDSVFLGI